MTKRLEPEDLRLRIDPHTLGFELLGEYAGEARETIAQDRARRAIEFGLRMHHAGYHIYVAGDPETGMAEFARTCVDTIASEARTPPSDWCYLYNFATPEEPVAVELQGGMGRELRRDMAGLVDALKLHIPRIFESEAYLARKEEIARAFNQGRAQILEGLDAAVKEKGFVLQTLESGTMIAPAKEDGTVYTIEEIEALPEEMKKVLKERSALLHREMASSMRRIHELEQGMRERQKALDREFVRQTVTSLVSPLRSRYGNFPPILSHLDHVTEDVVQNHDDFRPKPEAGPVTSLIPGLAPSLTRYEVNVIVDNAEARGAPVIVEDNPTYPHLFGTMERKAQFGALFTDFTMIRPGSLHRANGGFLIVKALDLLRWPFSYQALKRALREERLDIEDMAEQFGLLSTKTMRPRPVPLRLKVVLVGDPFLYELIYSYDDEFKELFKVKAHLDIHVDRDRERLGQFLSATKALVRREGLRDIHGTGVARLVEYSAELAESREKLSLRMTAVADTAREADYWAGVAGSEVITGEHVQKALDERRLRSNLYEEHLEEMLMKDLIRVRTTGAEVGQVNGLAVHETGGYEFGRPSRITASVSLGREGIVNIEREAELSGNIHTKGVMILAGFLRERFASHRPLSLTASLCFEQSYGLVEGDSASGAELAALLSAISGVPADQGIAITGAVGQKGELLPVGAVTKKIGGFFNLCQARGLTGKQGVIIPNPNVRELMLDRKVVEAVREGKFHVWAAETIEEAVELLTGMPAGVRGPEGTFPEGTLFALVDQRLEELAEEAKRFGHEEEEGEEEEHPPSVSEEGEEIGVE